jgi:hypothetical protein
MRVILIVLYCTVDVLSLSLAMPIRRIPVNPVKRVLAKALDPLTTICVSDELRRA